MFDMETNRFDPLIQVLFGNPLSDHLYMWWVSIEYISHQERN